jgi:hypothetical protein
MPLAENIAAGEAAIAYVKGLGIKALNKRSDRIAAAGGIDQVVGTNQGAAAMNSAATQNQFQAATGPLLAAFSIARSGGANGDTIREHVARYIQQRRGTARSRPRSPCCGYGILISRRVPSPRSV